MRNIKSQGGFTIIEVMIVVMVIGVLAAIVLPSVRQYAIRAKVSEVMLAFSHCVTAVSEISQSGEPSPGADNFGCGELVGTPDPAVKLSQYVWYIKTEDDGTITATLLGFGDTRVDTLEITMAPLDFQGKHITIGQSRITQWRCGSTLDGNGGKGTTLPPTYLPGSCKG
jgi:prepilin-type N-terminal cleavage/methylation domain-containing protein